jgi:cytochrome P450
MDFGIVRLLRLSRDPLGFLTAMRREHGDFARYRIGPRWIRLASDPEIIREVLVTQAAAFHKDRGTEAMKPLLGEGLLTSEGEAHRRSRRLLQPAFQHARIAGYGATMVEHALRARDSWRDGAELDFVGEMMRVSLGIVGKTLFDAETAEDAETVRRALSVAMENFQLWRVPVWRLLLSLPIPSSFRFARARRELDGIVLRLIREHRARPRDDLLSTLMRAVDPEGTGALDEAELRDEAMTLLLAGHETTAVALCWTFWLLAQNPQVEARLHEEIDSVLRGAPPSAADLERLPYVRQVLSESMRLYPPAWAVGRTAQRDVELRGEPVRAGTTVVLSQWVVHRDPALWPDPLRFDPERFAPSSSAGRPRFAYFPFGGGPRTCIGDGFAWLSTTLLLTSFAQNFRFRIAPGQRIEPLARVTLRLKHGLRMTAERRTSATRVRAAAD